MWPRQANTVGSTGSHRTIAGLSNRHTIGVIDSLMNWFIADIITGCDHMNGHQAPPAAPSERLCNIYALGRQGAECYWWSMQLPCTLQNSKMNCEFPAMPSSPYSRSASAGLGGEVTSKTGEVELVKSGWGASKTGKDGIG